MLYALYMGIVDQGLALGLSKIRRLIVVLILTLWEQLEGYFEINNFTFIS